MKRTISFILAALLAASAFTACEKNSISNDGTPAVETKVPETKAETTAPETTEVSENTPAFPTDLLTENGEAKAVIVIPEAADHIITMASEELQYHIKKVSGADVSVVSGIAADTLSIVIGTPDTVPALAEMFPEDIAWLSELGEVGETERYGDDGFAIRQSAGVIYIFGITPKGALNGTYDFIEENMDILWIRADEEIGLVYDEMPTITVQSVDYREKSPFDVRGWHLAGYRDYSSDATERMLARNKFNSSPQGNEKFGFFKTAVAHNTKLLVKNSPLYDPAIDEYWNTDTDGNHLDYETSPEINYYSNLAAEAVAASLIKEIGYRNR